MLAQNPRLDQWVRFPAPGLVSVATGRVEIGQGVLTAMLQIAAEELDLAPERIRLETGDTELTPNEGYTAGSQSIQFGGVALRLACAEVRGAVSRPCGGELRLRPADLSVEDGAMPARGEPTGHDYWTLAGAVDLAAQATGRRAASRPASAGSSAATCRALDLAGKVFGEPVFVHDMALDGMVHARVVRQPRPGATIKTIDEAAMRRAAKGPIEILRDGNFVAILGDDETVVEAAAAVAPDHVGLGRCRRDRAVPGGGALAVAAALDRPGRSAPPPSDPNGRGGRYEATYTRMHIAHASVAPSCGLAVYATAQMQVWTHSQGRLPAARRARPDIEARSRIDLGQARAGAGLLRP